MKKRLFILFFALMLVSLSSKGQKLFTQILSEESSIKFNNAITETKGINNFTYGYLYNGGGVAVGDINNDGLSDLYFSGSMVFNKLYLNQGDFYFKDITESAGVDGGIGFKTGVSMIDINNDGLLDMYVCKSALSDPSLRKNVLYVNNGDLTFREEAKAYGIDDASYSTQGYFYDMDVDGDLDLFLLNHPPDMNYANKIQLYYDKSGKLVAQADTERTYVSCRYYENVNNHFKDRTFSAGLGTHSFGLSAIIDDFNNDGYPDIYTCNDYHKPDYLFINNKNKTFTNKADQYFKHFSYSSMGSDYADINNDGFLDLIVVDMMPELIQRQKQLKGVSGNFDVFYKRVHYGFGYQYEKNVLQLNNGNNTYSDISYLAGVAFTDWSWAPLIADYDNDGLKDIYITNGYLRDVTDADFMAYDGDSIQKELFKASTSADAMKVLSGIPSTKVLNYYFKNNGNLTFTNTALGDGLDMPSWSNGAAYSDLDNDGDLDLIVNNINEDAFVFRNNSIENNLGKYIRFKLKGNENNINGIGTAIEIVTPDGRKQVQHFMPLKGFLSTNENFVHFGTGNNETANVTVTWMGGKKQIISGLATNQVYTLDIADADTIRTDPSKVPLLFRDITKQANISWKHKENSFIDFKREPLLPHQFSMQGPCIAVADINGDGRDDFFVGGSKDNEAALFKQDSSGKFSLTKQPQFILDKKYEDTGAEFIDFDNDGDMDLLVASGGNEYPENEVMYPARLYANDGKGNFTRSNSIEGIYTSGKAIAVDDYDKDGDKDVFIGGRVVPGHYGLIPKSYLLRNDKGKFTDITSEISSLQNAGMVTDATWCDTNNDGWKELILVGEWMPLTIYKIHHGQSDSLALLYDNTFGWWNTIVQSDIDNDGDQDLVGGNLGLNSRYRGNVSMPVTMIVSDFDNNKSTDCVICVYQSDSISYPLVPRDNLLDQMIFLKKKFLRHKQYASAKITDIFTTEQLNKAHTFHANNMQSTIFINDGAGNFSILYMAGKAQISPVNAIIAEDADKDGRTDLLIAGNNYSTDVHTGRDDAGIGLVLQNSGLNKFRSMPVSQTGFHVPGDVKCMKKITVHNKPCIIIGKNKGEIQLISFTENSY